MSYAWNQMSSALETAIFDKAREIAKAHDIPEHVASFGPVSTKPKFSSVTFGLTTMVQFRRAMDRSNELSMADKVDEHEAAVVKAAIESTQTSLKLSQQLSSTKLPKPVLEAVVAASAALVL